MSIKLIHLGNELSTISGTWQFFFKILTIIISLVIHSRHNSGKSEQSSCGHILCTDIAIGLTCHLPPILKKAEYFIQLFNNTNHAFLKTKSPLHFMLIGKMEVFS